MKIKLSHVDQVATDQSVDGVYVKLQVRRTITHEPENKLKKKNKTKLAVMTPHQVMAYNPQIFKGRKGKYANSSRV